MHLLLFLVIMLHRSRCNVNLMRQKKINLLEIDQMLQNYDQNSSRDSVNQFYFQWRDDQPDSNYFHGFGVKELQDTINQLNIESALSKSQLNKISMNGYAKSRVNLFDSENIVSHSSLHSIKYRLRINRLWIRLISTQQLKL